MRFWEDAVIDGSVLEHMEAVCDESKRSNRIPCVNVKITLEHARSPD